MKMSQQARQSGASVHHESLWFKEKKNEVKDFHVDFGNLIIRSQRSASISPTRKSDSADPKKKSMLIRQFLKGLDMVVKSF